MRLLLIRHGEMLVRASTSTSLEAINRFATQQSDAGLSSRGELQSEITGHHLKATQPVALYTSPIRRASETATLIAPHLGLTPTTSDDLREVLTGALPAHRNRARVIDAIAGASVVPERARRAALGGLVISSFYRAWRAGITEGGESWESYETRVRRFLQALQDRHPQGSTVLAVAHGYLIFNLALLASRSPAKRLKLWSRPYIPNAGINEFALDGSDPSSPWPRLVRYADASHLR